MKTPQGARLRALLLGAAACAFAPSFAHADDAVDLAGVEVTARVEPPIAAPPATTEGVSAEDVRRTVNAVNVEDSLKYLPDILVRKRHVGDTQAPMTTRTSGVGASARSLIFADGVPLSALIGNNNGAASPRWGMVSPEEVARIDVLYGPFSAAYAGNSIGAVVNITTRQPTRLEGSFKVAGSWDAFRHYGAGGTYPAGQVAATLGDRRGDLSAFVSANHVESRSQPLAYVTATRPASPSAAGAPVTGAVQDLSRTGGVVQVLGAGGFEDQTEDTLKARLSWSPGPQLRVTWFSGLFRNATSATAETYLRDGAGAPVYSGQVNIGGYAYTIAAGAFSNTVYSLRESHLMNALTARGSVGAGFRWQATASTYVYDRDEQRTPTTALPAARNGGAGSIVRLDGTGWASVELSAAWRPSEGQEISFGYHADGYRLANLKFKTADWRDGPAAALVSASRGKTRTQALWAQDAISLRPGLLLTLGGRQEHWRAMDGFNFSASPALSVKQPGLSASRFSPKATLRWTPDDLWRVTASVGEAWRFPTVTELYQTVTTGLTLSVPDPRLRPEHAWSSELAIERTGPSGRLRLSLFREDLSDALISQSAPLVPGSPTLFSFVQNIERVRSRGAELVFEQRDLFARGFDVSGSLTYVDSRITRDTALPAAVGKRTPQIPRWRATLVATWRPNAVMSFTASARYSDRVFGTIDNSDTVTHTYQGFDGYLVADVRAGFALTPRWSAAVGVDNLGGRDYFLFHPFPQRTAYAELRYAF